MNKQIDELSIATIRSLVIDITNKAKSGHPGMAIGSAPILHTLYTRHLQATPKHSNWINRDRFVLSAGHASSLLYSMLHLAGYKVSIDDLKQFRQISSLTPGHPEYGWTDGVDATSGPLGQGIAMAVGMAVAEQSLKNNFDGAKEIVNHYTYALCGDGCLQEGISQEAISFAGHQKLNKLILFYDSNEVTLDGPISLSFSEDVKQRFIASEWDVIEVKDGNDIEEIDAAISKAKKSKSKPTMILVHTTIGYGTSKAGTNKVHGSPIGDEDGKNTKVNVYKFEHPDFYVPEEVKTFYEENFIKRNELNYDKWEKSYKKWGEKDSQLVKRFECLTSSHDVSKYIPETMPNFEENSAKSSRVASGQALNNYSLSLPVLIGGSADVAGSVMTKLDNGINFDSEHRDGHNFNFGIREFAMASIQNGILLHGGIRTYVGSFFVFSDYMKPAIRMAALSKLPAIYLFSHDSIAVGEDGPTHQPIEQLAALRSIPNVVSIRPCDERETYAAWKQALLSIDHPTALILSRQNLPLIKTSSDEGLSKGAYIISPEKDKCQFAIIATGSEVSLALQVQQELIKDNIDIRVISMPSFELFEKQDDDYKNSVLSIDREHTISLEMLSTFGWDRYAKYHIGLDEFGTSAPAKDALSHFGFTVNDICAKVRNILGNK